MLLHISVKRQDYRMDYRFVGLRCSFPRQEITSFDKIALSLALTLPLPLRGSSLGAFGFVQLQAPFEHFCGWFAAAIVAAPLEPGHV